MKLNLEKILLTILIVLFIPRESFLQEKEDVYATYIKEVLSSLENLISKNYNKNPAITEKYLFVKDKIDKNELKFSISKNLPKSIIGGMNFTFGKENKQAIPFIVISDYFVEIYKKNPSLTYTVLFHEFQHVYNYFNHYEKFLSGETNKLEKYLFEMDAIYTEAMFIRDIAKPNNYKLTDYECYVVDSLAKDNLNSISITFEGHDMKLIYKLVYIAEGKESKINKITQIEKIGTELIGKLPIPETESDWNKFVTLTSLVSYYVFVPQFLYKIEFVASKNTLKTTDFKMGKYTTIKTYRDEIIKLVNQNSEFMKQYSKITREKFISN